MGLFDRSFSLNKNREISEDEIDEIISNLDKVLQDIDLSGSGGEREKLQENIEKSKLSFYNNLVHLNH